MTVRRFPPILPAFFLLLLLAACAKQAPQATPTSQPAPTETAQPPARLTICLGQEPESLYPLDNPSSAAQSILAALYDGPIDTNAYGYQAVILERLPTFANGDAQLFPKEVSIGDEVVDDSGTPVTLGVGIKVRPAGCRSGTCAVTYDGKTSLQMDQMQVTFRLLPGLTWSDGEPLTAADSVYGYTVSAEQSISTAARYAIDRTQTYEAADEATVQWWGKPGFIDPAYVTNFWFPLPEHAWGTLSMDQLGDTPETSRTPLGWGPFVIQEWVNGDHLTLQRNGHYFRQGEGLPRADELTFRFIPEAETAISELLAGRCDLLDPSINLDGQTALLKSMADQDQLQAFFTTLPVMEQLAFGIWPAAYEDGRNGPGDRPDFFGDVRVRQAVALCLDREQVAEGVLLGLSPVPNSFIPAENPLINLGAPAYSYNVDAASKLLDEAGWKDEDGNPATARVADGNNGAAKGTPFEVTYLTSNAIQRQQVSSLLAASLGKCGLKVNVELVSAETLYAPGPEGRLFGRNFDLAEFAMGSLGMEPPCDWFTTMTIPGKDNDWVGTNVSGYSSQAYDLACQESNASLPDEAGRAAAFARVQTIFMEELPVVPLYWRVRSAAAAAGVCNFTLDATASSALWNIESIAVGEACREAIGESPLTNRRSHQDL